MSSPPSSTGGSAAKRKRPTDVAASFARASTTDLQQLSSGDASTEEGDDSAALSGSSRTRKISDTGDKPPSKRARTRAASQKNGENPIINQQDSGEPSETTEDSMDLEREASIREPGQTQESIKPPERAGLCHPKGYKTNPPPTGRPVRVYADGVFDLFHLGHMRQLEQAKTAFPDVFLIVGVTGDAETHKRKGLTVLTGAERAETIRHCKWVDQVIPNCPWIVTPEFLDEHNIDYVAHDDEPYGAAEGDDIYAPIKQQGKFLVTQRTEGVSTTGIITKIVRDYEKYIARQLKRGTSRQELNISWLKKNELDLKRHVVELRDSIRNNWSTTGQELGKEIKQFWQSSRPGSPARQSLDAPRGHNGGMMSPGGAFQHLAHLDIPRPDSPGALGRNEDFATGYSLGLIGGVRGWMMRGRRSLRDNTDSQPPSPGGSGSDEDNQLGSRQHNSDPKSPTGDESRGRKRAKPSIEI